MGKQKCSETLPCFPFTSARWTQGKCQGHSLDGHSNTFPLSHSLCWCLHWCNEALLFSVPSSYCQAKLSNEWGSSSAESSIWFNIPITLWTSKCTMEVLCLVKLGNSECRVTLPWDLTGWLSRAQSTQPQPPRWRAESRANRTPHKSGKPIFTAFIWAREARLWLFICREAACRRLEWGREEDNCVPGMRAAFATLFLTITWLSGEYPDECLSCVSLLLWRGAPPPNRDLCFGEMSLALTHFLKRLGFSTHSKKWDVTF